MLLSPQLWNKHLTMLPSELKANIKLLAPLPQCIMLWDRSLCCKTVSKSTAHNLLGIESRFIEHQLFGDLPIRNEARSRIRKAFDTARDSGRKTEILQSLYINNVRTEVETAFIPQYEDGAFSGIITVCHSSAALKELKTRTETLVRATAHDLRTPVNNLLNLCKLLNVEASDDLRSSIVQRMTNAVSILSEQLEGMMVLAETRSDVAPVIERIDIAASIEEVNNIFHEELHVLGATLSTNLQATQLEFSKGYFRNILLNLIGNAIKYRSADRKLLITVQTHAASNGLWLEVSDNGIGIDLNGSGDLLFKPFTRLTNQGEGHGLGLSLVKSFVEDSGGEIHVFSEPGNGTTFRVLLPNQSVEVLQ